VAKSIAGFFAEPIQVGIWTLDINANVSVSFPFSGHFNSLILEHSLSAHCYFPLKIQFILLIPLKKKKALIFSWPSKTHLLHSQTEHIGRWNCWFPKILRKTRLPWV
jgi:hypothetical protein